VAILWAGHAAGHAAHHRGAARARAPRETAYGWGAVVRAAALTMLCAGVPMALGGVVTGLGFAWLNPASTPGRNEQWTSLPTSVGIAVGAVGHLLGHDEWRDTGIAVARAVALVVLALLLVVIWFATLKPGHRGDPGRADRRRVVRGLAWALLAVVVLAPVFLGWYYLWMLPVFAVSLDEEWAARLETPLAAVATVVCFATLPEGYSLGLTTTVVGVPFAVVVGVLLVRRGLRTARRADWRHLSDLGRPLLPGR
jgi:alpha-1,6-mannosyltransferase